MKGLFYGIDGGATRCRLAIWDEEKHLVYQDEGESSNSYAVGFEQASKHVITLLEKAMQNPLIANLPVKGFCFGSAGLARAIERQRWEQVFDTFFAKEFPRLLVSDAEILLAGSHQDPTGLCLIAGTGSICLGRNQEGEIVRSGGMGTGLGDEGSAWWIAHEAVRRTLKSRENRDLKTNMEATIHSFFHLSNAEECIPFFNDRNLTKSAVADFAPFVTTFANQGDALAQAIIDQAADELVLLVLSVEARLSGTFHRRLTLAGGVLEHDRTIRNLFLQKLPKSIVVCPNKGTALEGALILAYNAKTDSKKDTTR